jgi:hypothetical protein
LKEVMVGGDIEPVLLPDRVSEIQLGHLLLHHLPLVTPAPGDVAEAPDKVDLAVPGATDRPNTHIGNGQIDRGPVLSIEMPQIAVTTAGIEVVLVEAVDTVEADLDGVEFFNTLLGLLTDQGPLVGASRRATARG